MSNKIGTGGDRRPSTLSGQALGCPAQAKPSAPALNVEAGGVIPFARITASSIMIDLDFG